MKKIKIKPLQGVMLIFAVGILFSLILLYKERYFVPASAPFFAGVVSAAVILLTYYAVKDSETSVLNNMTSMLLPSTAIAFSLLLIVIVDPYRFIGSSLAVALVSVVCAFVLMLVRGSNNTSKLVITAVNLLVLFPLFSILMSVLSSGAEAGRAVQSAYISPKGTYRAEVITNNIDGTARVNAVKEGDTVDLLLFKLEPWEKAVYTGEVKTVEWKNDEILLINGNEYDPDVAEKQEQ